MRNNTIVKIFVTLALLLVKKPTVAVAFATQPAPFLKNSATKMTTAANDGGGIALPARRRKMLLEREKKEWISRSVDYYSKVMREERRRNMGQELPTVDDKYVILAKKHYWALKKIKTGKLHHAEYIYRRIIDALLHEEEGECDHAQLAVTTLLLALLMQRMGDRKATRAVFLNFFRIAALDNDETECACSAKVLCAYALFEMKQGNRNKSLQLARRAIQFDSTLAPVLEWKQFRDAAIRRSTWQRGGQQLAP